jgi:hypothetical protein
MSSEAENANPDSTVVPEVHVQAPSPAEAAAPVPAADGGDDDAFLVRPKTDKPIRRGKVARYDGCSMRDWNTMLAHRKPSYPTLPNGSPNAAAMRRVSEAEVRRHDQPQDLWMVIRGIVYDCSSWGRFHPGGLDTLMECAGRDGTALFDLFHRWVATEVMLAPFIIGLFDPRLKEE